jgi:hypothetical protein
MGEKARGERKRAGTAGGPPALRLTFTADAVMVRIESMRIIADDLEPGERISVQSRSRESSGMQIVGYDRSQPAGSTARRIVTDVVAVCAVTFCANSCESPIILAVRKAPTITSTVDARIPAVRRNVHTTRQHSGASRINASTRDRERRLTVSRQ